MCMWKKAANRTVARRVHAFETELTPSVDHSSKSLRVVPAVRDQDAFKLDDRWQLSIARKQENTVNEKGYTWEQWFDLYKTAAGGTNPALAVNARGGSLLDFMDKAPLQDAFERNMCPSTMGPGQNGLRRAICGPAMRRCLAGSGSNLPSALPESGIP